MRMMMMMMMHVSKIFDRRSAAELSICSKSGLPSRKNGGVPAGTLVLQQLITMIVLTRFRGL